MDGKIVELQPKLIPVEHESQSGFKTIMSELLGQKMQAIMEPSFYKIFEEVITEN